MGNRLDTEPVASTTMSQSEYNSLIARAVMGDTPTLNLNNASTQEFRATGTFSDIAANRTTLLGIYTAHSIVAAGDGEPFNTRRTTHQPARLVSAGMHRNDGVRLEVHLAPGAIGAKQETPYRSDKAA